MTFVQAEKPNSGGIGILHRVALTKSQAQEILDSGVEGLPLKEHSQGKKWFVENFGEKAWEIDALSPAKLKELVRSSVSEWIEWKKWNRRGEQVNAWKREVERITSRFKPRLEETCKGVTTAVGVPTIA